MAKPAAPQGGSSQNSGRRRNSRRRKSNAGQRPISGQNVNRNLNSQSRINVKNQKPQTQTIVFDEFIQEINGTTSTSVLGVTKIPINPGLPGSFPEASIEAALWTEWKMIECEFYYRPEVSQYAQNGQSGKVILSVDYNAANPAPTTRQQVEIMPHVDFMPYEAASFCCDAKYVNRSDAKYIRTGQKPSNTDIKTYDGGNFYVSTIGNQATTVLGELHVRSKWLVSKPTLLNSSGAGNNESASFFQSTTAETAGATTVATKMLFATASANGANITNSSGSFTPPAGNYLVSASVCVNNSTITLVQLDVQKNGSSIYLATKPTAESTSNLYSTLTTGGLFISCNGSDVITFPVTNTYSSGSPTQSGTVLFEMI
jgi:hypothetical protein